MAKNWALIFLSLFFSCNHAFAQIGPGGLTPRGSIQAENGGSRLGTALTVNCDGMCIVCTMTGTTMNISFNSSCGGGGASFDLLLEDGTYLLLESGGKIIL